MSSSRAVLLCVCFAFACTSSRVPPAEPQPAELGPAPPSSSLATAEHTVLPSAPTLSSVPGDELGSRADPRTSTAGSGLTPPVVAESGGEIAPPRLEVHALEIDGLRPLIERAIRKQQLPGAVVAVGSSSGLSFLEAFGERTAGEAMTVDTLFDVASVTKAVVTTTAVWQLIEQGRLSLDTRVSDVLAPFARPDKRAITVRQLLLHTSGLRSVLALDAFASGADPALEAVAQSRLEAEPGVQFRYSDLGFFVLGRLVEAVSGEALDGYAANHIFTPLGMRDSGFRPDAAQRPRCAPTEERDGLVIRGVVDDPRAYRLGGVAGHAGLFSTARDLARFAQALLRGGELEGQRVLGAEAVALGTRAQAAGAAERALGWDVRSSYSEGRGHLLSARAFGHGGYTGTNLWIDPERDLFVMLLSNRVHSGASGTIHPLASAVVDLGVHAMASSRDTAPQLAVGIDELAAEAFARLRGARIGVLSHFAARDAKGQSSLDVLRRAPRVVVRAVFAPEHGLFSNREGALADGALGEPSAAPVPVYSLFGAARVPTAKQLAGLDVVVIDLVDVGTRFYTYMSTARAMLEACAALGVDVLVLDRPNPIGADVVEGPISEPSFESFVNYAPLPLRHGLTAGELLGMLARARGLAAPDVVRVRAYERHMLFAETGLSWHPPSPNLPSAEQALLYPAVALLEGTRVSVGRGTSQAFRVVGAPFIDGPALAAALEPLLPASVSVKASSFVPRVGPHAGKRVSGVELGVSDAHAFRAAPVGLALARALLRLYRDALDESRLDPLIAHAATLEALRSEQPLSELPKLWEQELERYDEARRPYLLYGAGKL